MKKHLKSKGFVIDKISEDSFYENLLLGLPSVLRSSPFVSQLTVERYPPTSVEELSHWENFHATVLPKDLRDFYLSTNGFSLSYKFQYAGVEDDAFVMGGIEIHPLSQVGRVLTQDNMYWNEAGVKVLAPKSAVFVLAELEDDNSIVIAQFSPPKPPNIWFYYKKKVYYWLCEDFPTYLRMAIAHLGIPGWQLVVLKGSPPEWSNEIFQILAPNIFANRHLIDNQADNNVLNINIFNEEIIDEIEIEISGNDVENSNKVTLPSTPKKKPITRNCYNKKKS